MVITKKLNLNNIFVFLFLVLFPFGQIIRIGIVQPIDVVVGLAALYAIIAKLKKPPVLKYINTFLVMAVFSWFFSIFIFHKIEVLYGLLYLLRLFAYSYFVIYVWAFVQEKRNKELLITSLLSISVISAAIGWIQLLLFPNIKPMFIWGWDMHLYRLVGTFFDPTYLGLIIVFGLIISINRLIDRKNKLYFIATMFLVISLAFTYSRASYIAFFVSLFVIAISKKIYKQLFVLAIVLIVLITILPTTRNHSIELFRSFSVVARIENYNSTLQIFAKSPVFGVGYNNMCIAYNKFIGYQKFSSHACWGSDSSLLFILATTGVSGLFIFIYLISKIKNLISQDTLTSFSYSSLLIPVFWSLLVHSLFSNSMFYPWIIGWIVILLAVAL